MASAEAGSGNPPMAATSAKLSPGPTICNTCSFPPGPVLNTRTSPWPTTYTPGHGSFSRKITCPLRNWHSRADRGQPPESGPPDLGKQAGNRARCR